MEGEWVSSSAGHGPNPCIANGLPRDRDGKAFFAFEEGFNRFGWGVLSLLLRNVRGIFLTAGQDDIDLC
jgi:hypothetical protein